MPDPSTTASSLFASGGAPAATLRARLEAGPLLRVPGCFDGLSARILAAAGFEAAFLGGFSVAATRLGLPDVGLMSYAEILDTARNVCAATSLPIFGDADTGYGNAINAERALLGYARAGVAAIMIEDQRWPKRCGHTAGKEVVDRAEALRRIRACARLREEQGLSILIMARTDANACEGFDEALWRCHAFVDAGAEITFLEAPESQAQLERYAREVPGFTTANLVEDGKTPWLMPEELEAMGVSLALYPVTLLLHALRAMERAAEQLSGAGADQGDRARFDDARARVGWGEYEARLRGLD